MEVTTAPPDSSTASNTMADLASKAAAKHGERKALKHKVGGEWRDISYRQLGETVSEVARGLIDLGLEHGDRVAILSGTRPEWTYANLAILASGAVSVSIYQTNSVEECHYVLEHSECRAVFVENGEQLAKVREVESDLPVLEHVIVFDPPAEAGDAISLGTLRERGAAHEQSELDARTAAVSRKDHCITIYTSGTTGPPKGCVVTHGNYRDVTTMIEQTGVIHGDDQTYLFLPLAHSFAKLVQFVLLDLGGSIAYWQGDVQKIVPDLIEVQPTSFPSVPRMFEKIYTLARAGAEDIEAMDEAIELGLTVRRMRTTGEQISPELQARFEAADDSLYSNVRGLLGGNIRECVTGGAPISEEILAFFYACGVPVMEAYGMTETSTAATINTTEALRFGSVGKPLPRMEMRVADDGELLLRGPNIFGGYYRDVKATREALIDGWLHSGDLGHIDEDGFVFVSGRKKDIIITAGGKNITPSNLENAIKRSRWVSQAVVIGDRRPYLSALITLDPEQTPAFAEQHRIAVDDLSGSEQMRAEIQTHVDTVNASVGRVEQVKRFTILPADLTQGTGELTPTLKVKRHVVEKRFAAEIEALYAA